MFAGYSKCPDFSAEISAIEFRDHPTAVYKVSCVEQVLFVDTFLEDKIQMQALVFHHLSHYRSNVHLNVADIAID